MQSCIIPDSDIGRWGRDDSLDRNYLWSFEKGTENFMTGRGSQEN